jgi:hypothetical protein
MIHEPEVAPDQFRKHRGGTFVGMAVRQFSVICHDGFLLTAPG